MEIFYFMLIWNLLSSTNCSPLGLITWRHYPEISCDEHKCTWKPGNMVERHLWTKNPQLFFTRKIFAELFKKVKRCFLNFSKKNLCGFFVHKWRSTIFPVCGFFVHNSQIGVKSLKAGLSTKYLSEKIFQKYLFDFAEDILKYLFAKRYFFGIISQKNISSFFARRYIFSR